MTAAPARAAPHRAPLHRCTGRCWLRKSLIGWLLGRVLRLSGSRAHSSLGVPESSSESTRARRTPRELSGPQRTPADHSSSLSQ